VDISHPILKFLKHEVQLNFDERENVEQDLALKRKVCTCAVVMLTNNIDQQLGSKSERFRIFRLGGEELVI
jgi:hypothetical protein